jgi:hypothetical protein
MEIRLNGEFTTTSKTRVCYDKADYKAIINFLNIDRNTRLKEINDINDMWQTIFGMCQEAENKFIPKRTIKNKRHKYPLDQTTRTKINRKKRLWKKYIDTGGNRNIYDEYCKTRNQVRRETRKAQKQYEKNISISAKNNPKKFWNYVQSKTKVRSGIPDLQIPSATEHDMEVSFTKK